MLKHLVYTPPEMVIITEGYYKGVVGQLFHMDEKGNYFVAGQGYTSIPVRYREFRHLNEIEELLYA